MPDVKDIALGLHPLEREALKGLACGKHTLKGDELATGLHMLAEKGLVLLEKSSKSSYFLTPLGKKYVKEGLPEIRLLGQLSHPKKLKDIDLAKDELSPALGIVKGEGYAEIKGGILSLTEKGKRFIGEYSSPLERVGSLGGDELAELMRRGIVKESSSHTLAAKPTPEGLRAVKALESLDIGLIDELTEDMLKSGSWEGKVFRHYDVHLKTGMCDMGRRHPMMEANNILRDIFIEMGFREMEGPMVENAFWNMDVMWIPQDHPARDEQDTFYIDGSIAPPKGLTEKVREMHEQGIRRTHTEKGGWSIAAASRMLLRTHSTATSFRVLHALAQEARKAGKGDIDDGKYFYIARNFRNEKTDATHLAEFFHAEGFIVGDALSLADLMGFVKEYYSKLGITKIRFKPTFNPYTEPSMEAHYYDEKLGKWYALINSGIFRPETLRPLGISKTIIAWGMGASRLAALLTGKKSMREITGGTCDIGWLKERPNLTRDVPTSGPKIGKKAKYAEEKSQGPFIGQKRSVG